MATTRLPLRDRCNITLNVSTHATYWNFDEGDISYTQGWKKHAKFRMAIHGDRNLPAHCESQPRRPDAEDDAFRSLQEILPGVFLSLYSSTMLGAMDLSYFTHIVRISHTTSPDMCGRSQLERSRMGKQDTLRLFVSSPSMSKPRGRREPARGPIRTTTVLTIDQLVVARDFLSLVLPYYSVVHPVHPRLFLAPTPADAVRLLIMAPEGDPGAPADIMSVVACYLSFASREQVTTVLEYICEEEDVQDVWKGVLGSVGKVFVQHVAFMDA